MPGLLWRHGAAIEATGDATPREDLDELPVPDYSSFLEQMARSEWGEEHPILLFEGSRGCWWGEKHHCRFCGLRADGLHFRRKSAERVSSEVDFLAERYPQHRVLYATDSILDFQAPRGMLQSLAELRQRRAWKLFFEIKSNFGRGEVALLAAAGVTTVQPGIESFSDRVLELMDKGSNAVGNVELLRSLAAYRIKPLYNLIIGTPGERAEDYSETLDLLPHLQHLPAPAQVCFLQLDRFSPYFRNPAAFGMSAIEAEPVYRVIYPRTSIDLSKLVYRFQYDSAEQHDAALRDAWFRLDAAVAAWRVNCETRGLWWQDLGDRIVITEEREGHRTQHWLSGAAAELYRLCDRGGSTERFGKRLPAVAPRALHACLERWLRRGWIFRFRSGAHLALAHEWEPKPAARTETAGARPLPALVQLSIALPAG